MNDFQERQSENERPYLNDDLYASQLFIPSSVVVHNNY